MEQPSRSYTDSVSNTVVFPAASSGGTGLTVGGSTTNPVNGYVDWLGHRRQPALAGGTAAPTKWFYKRLWQISSPTTGLKQMTVMVMVRSSVGGAAAEIDGGGGKGMAVLTSARTARHELGFSLLELIVATTVLLVVSSIFTSGLMQVTRHQQTVWNRTEMHSGVRSATELLQQEIDRPTDRVAGLAGHPSDGGGHSGGHCAVRGVFGGGWSGGVTATVTLSSVAGIVGGHEQRHQTDRPRRRFVGNDRPDQERRNERGDGLFSRSHAVGAPRGRTRRALAKGSSGRARRTRHPGRPRPAPTRTDRTRIG